MTPMFNGRRPFIFFIESLKERDTSRFNIRRSHASTLFNSCNEQISGKNGQICTPTIEDVHDS